MAATFCSIPAKGLRSLGVQCYCPEESPSTGGMEKDRKYPQCHNVQLFYYCPRGLGLLERQVFSVIQGTEVGVVPSTIKTGLRGNL